MSEQHGRNGYLRGCRCDVCRAGQRECIAAQRARKRGLAPVADLVPSTKSAMPSTKSAIGSTIAPGPCELATLAELETLPAAQSHLAFGQAALCMARILDNR